MRCDVLREGDSLQMCEGHTPRVAADVVDVLIRAQRADLEPSLKACLYQYLRLGRGRVACVKIAGMEQNIALQLVALIDSQQTMISSLLSVAELDRTTIGELAGAVSTLQDEQAELRDELHALSRTLNARTEHAV